MFTRSSAILYESLVEHWQQKGTRESKLGVYIMEQGPGFSATTIPKLIAILVAGKVSIISSDVLLASDPSGERQVLRKEGHPAGMDGAQVGILEQPDEVRLGPLVERLECRRLKPEGSAIYISYMMMITLN